jgi:aryl-alcohol dehydrogenase-like predicted oxidoreductase
MTVLTEVVRQGKARYIGLSEWPADTIRAALAMTGVEPFVSSQPQYSLLWRAPKTEIMPLCAANGISQVVWSPLAQGVLTGKYQPGASPPADARASNAQMGAMFRRDWLESPILEAVQRLKPIVREAGLTLAQFALAWVLRQPNVAAAIAGATRPWSRTRLRPAPRSILHCSQERKRCSGRLWRAEISCKRGIIPCRSMMDPNASG